MSPSPKRSDIDDLVDFIVVSTRFSRAVSSQTDSALPRAMWRILSELETHSALRISDLARLDRVAQPTATAMVARLDEAGYVQRTQDPDDGRATLVSLTPSGRRKLVQIRNGMRDVLTERTTALDGADRAVLKKAMNIIARIIEEGFDHDSPGQLS